MKSTFNLKRFAQSRVVKKSRLNVRTLRLESLENREMLDGLALTGTTSPEPDDVVESSSTIVTTLADVVDSTDNVISLREAVACAGANGLGNTITFAQNLNGQTITLTLGQIEINNELTIDASLLSNGITISGGHTTGQTDGSRVFYVGNLVSFKHLTLTDGYVDDDYYYGSGGAVYIGNSGDLEVENCVVYGNTATQFGGGIYVEDHCSFTATNTTITGNTACDGGGVYVGNYATFTAKNTTITENTASNRGGGVFVGYTFTSTSPHPFSFSAFTATNTSISGNSAKYGGGIYNTGFSVTTTRTTILDNTASSKGGGVYVCGNGSFTTSNTAITKNSATTGGAVYFTGGSFTAKNATIAGNAATRCGGVSVSNGGTFKAYNTIVATNTANSYADVLNNNGTTKGYYSLSSYAAWTGDSCGNLVYDSSRPLFVDAIRGNYSLACNSQAINVGKNAYSSRFVTDLAGHARIMDVIVDIGAYEYDPKSICIWNDELFVAFDFNRYEDYLDSETWTTKTQKISPDLLTESAEVKISHKVKTVSNTQSENSISSLFREAFADATFTPFDEGFDFIQEQF